MTEAPVLDRPAESPTATETPTGPLADLILVRLLAPRKNPLRPGEIQQALVEFFENPPTTQEVKETLEALRDSKLISSLSNSLTETGRAHALGYLGISTIQPKSKWNTVKAKLVPVALGLSAKAVENADKLAAVLLKRKLNLPVGTGDTITAVFDALACRELGFPDKAKLNLRDAILSKHIGETKPLSTKDLKRALPARLLEPQGKGTDGFRKLALKGFADANGTPARHPEPQSVADETFDLEDFANTVLSVARKSTTGRFGDNKVFISHVWRQLKDEPRFARLGTDGFKSKLVDANRARYLDLLPADLNQAFAESDIAESATINLHSTYHFIATGDGQ